MSTSSPPASQVRPPIWRDIRVLRWIGQIAVLAVVIAGLAWLYSNATTNLRTSGLPTGFRWLDQPYGVDIPGATGARTGTVLDAFMVGYANTIRIIAVGIPACTIIGILIGIARLSENAFVRAFGTLYVETFRNVPVLLWILLAFGVVLTQNLPAITEALEPLGLAIFSNRGIFIPWVRGTCPDGAPPGTCPEPTSLVPLLIAFGIGVLAWVLIAAWRSRVNARTGQPARGGLFGIIAFLAIMVLGYFVAGAPAEVTIPAREGRLVTGGINVFINYAALLVALTLYTASHVAEIVRGAILAVPRGQTEAANALALSTYQRYRFVVLPQAFRIMIPPLASQYLNITKNSSLGVAIGYFEITRIYTTVANNAAPAITAVVVLMGMYLTFSLGISVIANIINRSLQLESR